MKTYSIILGAICLITFTSCKEKEDPIIPNEAELITTLKLTLTNNTTGSSSNRVFSFQDLDGDGGASASISFDTLEANASYTGQISLLNEAKSPSEDILEEVIQEDDDHQFFYLSENLLEVSYSDSDENGLPLGAQTQIETDSIGGLGELTIILRHKPDKFAEGVSTGDITNAGGEADIEVVFPLIIE